jgi:hypothetical protein
MIYYLLGCILDHSMQFAQKLQEGIPLRSGLSKVIGSNNTDDMGHCMSRFRFGRANERLSGMKMQVSTGSANNNGEVFIGHEILALP